MRALFILLCGLFTLVPQHVKAQETRDVYERVVAEQEATRERKRAEGLNLREEARKAEVEMAEQEAREEAAEAEKQKSCGDDYMKIRVGMKVSQVQKCYGEFHLQGQVKTKDGVVSEYRRGNGYVEGSEYLYIKDGRVVAWGE